MKINTITSPANALLKRIRSLHERKGREKEHLFLVEGVKAIDEAFRKGLRLKDVVISESFLERNEAELSRYDLPFVSVVDDKAFKELAMTTTPAGILAVAEMPKYSLSDVFDGHRTLVVVANGLQDPGNLGTLMRTALAASASGIILVKGTVDPFNPKVVRSAMGALFALPVVWDVELEVAVAELKKHSARVFACDASASQMYFDVDMTGPTALIFGNEGSGFSDGQLKLADETISIPMNPQSESLNVSVSAAVVLFNVVQQRIKSQSSR